VGAGAFCNREKELADLMRAMENGEKLFVFSERRYGKTSLVRAALRKLPAKGYVSVYVDLWLTDSETTFATTFARAITESLSTSVDKLLETAKQFFGSLTASITVDQEGKATVSFGVAKTTPPGVLLEDVLEAPAEVPAWWWCLTSFSRFWNTAMIRWSGDSGVSSRITSRWVICFWAAANI
jgi:hypothetical protein